MTTTQIIAAAINNGWIQTSVRKGRYHFKKGARRAFVDTNDNTFSASLWLVAVNAS